MASVEGLGEPDPQRAHQLLAPQDQHLREVRRLRQHGAVDVEDLHRGDLRGRLRRLLPVLAARVEPGGQAQDQVEQDPVAVDPRAIAALIDPADLPAGQKLHRGEDQAGLPRGVARVCGALAEPAAHALDHVDRIWGRVPGGRIRIGGLGAIGLTRQGLAAKGIQRGAQRLRQAFPDSQCEGLDQGPGGGVLLAPAFRDQHRHVIREALPVADEQRDRMPRVLGELGLGPAAGVGEGPGIDAGPQRLDDLPAVGVHRHAGLDA